MTDLSKLSQADLIALVQKQSAQLAAASAPKTLTMKVSTKGALSIYGLGRFPVSLYRGQWERLAKAMPEILAFIEANAAQLSVKAD